MSPTEIDTTGLICTLCVIWIIREQQRKAMRTNHPPRMTSHRGWHPHGSDDKLPKDKGCFPSDVFKDADTIDQSLPTLKPPPWHQQSIQAHLWPRCHVALLGVPHHTKQHAWVWTGTCGNKMFQQNHKAKQHTLYKGIATSALWRTLVP